MSSEVEELVSHFFVTFYDEAYATEAKSIIYGELLSAAVTLFLKLRVGIIIT